MTVQENREPEEGGESEEEKRPSERGAEQYDDQDAGPAYTPEQAEADEDRDQAEG